MYNPEDSIGVEATDYLLDLGFDCEPSVEYFGDCIINQNILEDDGHPEHSKMLNEYVENSHVCMQWVSGKHVLAIRWDSAEIISYSDDFPPEIISTLKEFLDPDKEIIYVSDQKLSEIEEGSWRYHLKPIEPNFDIRGAFGGIGIGFR